MSIGIKLIPETLRWFIRVIVRPLQIGDPGRDYSKILPLRLGYLSFVNQFIIKLRVTNLRQTLRSQESSCLQTIGVSVLTKSTGDRRV